MGTDQMQRREHARRRAERNTIALGAALSAVSLAALVPLAPHLSTPRHPVAWWALAVGFALAETLKFHLEIDHETHTFTFSEAPLVLGLLFASPLGLIVARMVGELVYLLLDERTRLHKVFFNLSMFLAECVAALALLQWIAHGRPVDSPVVWFAMIVAIAGADVVSIGAVFLAIRWHGAVASARQVLLAGAFTAVTNTTIALLVAMIVERSWLALLLLGVVACNLSMAYRSYTSLQRRFERLQLFHDFTRAIGSGNSAPIVMERVLQQARQLMRVEYALIVLLASDDGTGETVFCELRGSRELEIRPDRTGAILAEPIVREAVTRRSVAVVARWANDAHEVSLRETLQVRDYVVAPLQGDGSVVGVLVLGERIGETSTFDEHDGMLVETLANHASVALENSRLIDRLTTEAREREFQALHDALTGLPNRTEFLRRLDHSLAAAETRGFNDGAPMVGVLLMDLDRFKEVNDTLGHFSGDVLLQEVARRVHQSIDETATVARFGGDEFAVLLPAVTIAGDAVNVADAIRGALDLPVRVGDVVIEIQSSIGIALAPEDGAESSLLLQRADVAMYEAKRTKSGVQLYDPTQDPHSLERLEFASSMRAAMERGDIVVYYQPKARLDGAIVGAEALARWQHEEYGLIAPSEFISVAEQNGLIGQLTDYVLDRALLDCAHWRSLGAPIGVAVNVSATCLVDMKFPERLREMLTRRVVPAEQVTLEITESGVLELSRARAIITALHELGVRLSVDDFGTGYSSLAYLHTLPVQEVKIDQRFVQRLASPDGDPGIVKAIIDLGHNLGLTVVAEGVEDRLTWEQLMLLGCDEAQGYHLSRPIPERDLARWLVRRQRLEVHDTFADVAVTGLGFA